MIDDYVYQVCYEYFSRCSRYVSSDIAAFELLNMINDNLTASE